MNNNPNMSDILSRYSQVIRLIPFSDSQILPNFINSLEYKSMKM